MSKTGSKPQFIMGWDIGGAHLKVVLLDIKGNSIASCQLACPLWRGMDYLERAILEVQVSMRKKIGLYNIIHAITMTGELVDLFANRHEGVLAISTLAAKLLGKNTLFYAANHDFVVLERVSALTPYIASANWHASASALAMQVDDAILIDIGSTTTDIVAIQAGKVLDNALSDAARMQADTLVYTGVVRTPVMALAQKLSVDNVETNVAAEYFATMADVYRLTGELKTDDAETADGKGKTTLESARRLARMVGHDVETKPMQTWINLANTCKSLQMNQIKAALVRVVHAKHLKPNMTILGAGAGSFLVKQIAEDLDMKFMYAWEPISTCFSRTNNQLQLVYSAGMTLAVTTHIDANKKHDLQVCFPAYAVALLAKQQLAQHA